MSIIDTLSEGFTTVFKRPWLAVVPVVLDLFLWLGPKLSVAPIVDRSIALLQNLTSMTGVTGTEVGTTTDLLNQAIQAMQQELGSSNLLSLLSFSRMGVPSVTAARLIDPTTDHWILTVNSTWQMIGLQLVILALGLFIACFYLGMIGQVVRGQQVSVRQLLRRVPTYWLHTVILMVPVSVLLAMLALMGIALGPLVFLVWVGIFWILLYLYFVPQAITMSDAGPMEALRDSFIVMRLSFWHSFLMIVLVTVISTGLSLIWSLLLGSAIGTLFGILANSLLGTGLLVAVFIYFRERLAAWHQLVQQQKANLHNV